MYAMPCDSVTVRGSKVILCYRPTDRGYNRYVTLDSTIKAFHQHFAVYLVDGQPHAFGVTVVDNLIRDVIAPEGDYFIIAKLWEEKYHKRVVFLRAFSMDLTGKDNINDAVAQHIAHLQDIDCESSV